MFRVPARRRFSAAAELTASPRAARAEASEQHVAAPDSAAPEAPVSWRARVRRVAAILVTLVVLLVGTIGGHRAWLAHAERGMRDHVEGLRRAGEPLSVAALVPAPVPDANNAALELCRAGGAIRFDDPSLRDGLHLAPVRLPMTPTQDSVLRQVLAANEKALSVMTAATRKPAIDWSGLNKASGSRNAFSVIRGQGVYRLDTLSDLLFVAALVAHVDGDEPAALERVEEMLFIAKAVAQRPTLHAYSYALMFEASALAALAHMMPDLRVGEGAGCVPRRQIIELAARLLDDRPRLEVLRRNARAERARQIAAFLPAAEQETDTIVMSADPWGPVPTSAVLEPTLKRSVMTPARLAAERQALEQLQRVLADLDGPGPLKVREGFSRDEDRWGADGSFVRAVTGSVYSIGRRHVGGVARRRVTAVALACRAYHLEGGEWPPADLAALVPDYLPSPPLDPLSEGGRPIAFVPDHDRPRVYSVGDDGIDGGGTCDGFMMADVPGASIEDVVLDLKRQPPKPTPVLDDESENP